MWKTTGKKPAELEDLLELPDEFKECWYWFLRLNAKRTSNGFGMNSLSYSEIEAFFRIIDYKPHSWELDLIDAFDQVAMQHYSKQQEQQQKKTKKPRSK